MRLLLREFLPLRTTQMLGNFASTTTLPHRYGDLTLSPFNLIRMTDKKFFAADHPMEITGVNADLQPMLGWERGIETDSSGHTYTVVNTTVPAPDNVSLSALGRGKRNPRSGVLIENPADWMEDIIRIAGRSETFPQLRAEASKAGLVLAGTIGGGNPQTINETLDAIAQSAGAGWTPTASRLYPTTDVVGRVVDLVGLEANGLTVQALLDDTADILDLFYDQNDATGQAQRYMRLEASPQRFGGVVVQKTLPFVRTPANAASVGTRMLGRMAGERLDVSYTAQRLDIIPGTWTRLIDNPEWPTPDANPRLLAIVCDATPDTNTTIVQAECQVSVPEIRITAHSLLLPPTAGASIEVLPSNGNATFIIRDDNKQPLPNARVSFDGSAPKTTDARGAVEFPYVPGAHKLAVEAPGMVPFEMDFGL